VRSVRNPPLTESSALRERLYPYRGHAIPGVYDFDWDHYDQKSGRTGGLETIAIYQLRSSSSDGVWPRRSRGVNAASCDLKRMDDAARRSSWIGKLLGGVRLGLRG